MRKRLEETLEEINKGLVNTSLINNSATASVYLELLRLKLKVIEMIGNCKE